MYYSKLFHVPFTCAIVIQKAIIKKTKKQENSYRKQISKRAKAKAKSKANNHKTPCKNNKQKQNANAKSGSKTKVNGGITNSRITKQKTKSKKRKQRAETKSKNAQACARACARMRARARCTVAADCIILQDTAEYCSILQYSAVCSNSRRAHARARGARAHARACARACARTRARLISWLLILIFPFCFLGFLFLVSCLRLLRSLLLLFVTSPLTIAFAFGILAFASCFRLLLWPFVLRFLFLRR